jgi:lysozyme family protein
MADFNSFFPTLLKHEGGFVNDPNDRGGATNKGVTFGTFTLYAKSLLNVDPTIDNLRALTDAQAGVIYKSQYWDKVHGDEITLQPLANIVFDFQVNSGNNAGKLLQRVLNTLGATPPLGVDGSVGKGTMAALARADQVAVYQAYKQGRKDFYNRIVANDPTQKRFINGWLARVDSFPDLAPTSKGGA